MTEHAASVEPAEPLMRGFREPVQQYRARCSCSWRSKPYVKRGQAQAAAVEHVVGHAPVLKPKQQRDTGFFG